MFEALGAYIRRRDLREGFGGMGACIWRDLFSEYFFIHISEF